MSTRARTCYSIARAFEPTDMTLVSYRIVGEPPLYVEAIYADDNDGTQFLVRHVYVAEKEKSWNPSPS